MHQTMHRDSRRAHGGSLPNDRLQNTGRRSEMAELSPRLAVVRWATAPRESVMAPEPLSMSTLLIPLPAVALGMLLVTTVAFLALVALAWQAWTGKP